MERCVIPASLFCSKLFRASSRWWRYPRARRSAIVAGICFIYLFFAVLQVSSAPADGKGRIGTLPLRHHDGVHGQKTDDIPTPTRSNVVYITLRSKRQKPAVIRATVRPKSRRKKVGTFGKQDAQAHGGKSRHGQDAWAAKRPNASDAWAKIIHKGLTLYKGGHFEEGADNLGSSIRIYSQKPPPWFSQEDMAHMRLLASSKVRKLERLQPEGSPSVLLFRSAGQTHSEQSAECSGGCGVIKPPVDMSEVFAFHLDRVLGLNRSLPTVSRRFRTLGGQLCPVTQWDPSITPISGQLTWSSYQTSLKYKCWQHGTPKPEWSCTSIHHHEWSRMALLDFLLQIHQRLDRNCCGFRPRPEDSCVALGYHGKCGNMDNTELSTIVHRKRDPHRLVFINNKGFFDRDEENLDFKLLEGIKELPDVAVGVLSSQRLRGKLLQSLFLDQLYWESQGGREGIEKLIDVIERRARVLLRYINAHGIKIIPMNK
ncbi:Golgi-associated kinase 1B [Pygocentrus nattereri]|uniref:Golgi associated kinase 1B n=1 Tax=Pygocentrus nattereri TaxID=42514 RepID=A0A3B4CRG4_PYGNA|nr:Golgi-associated kinase 1B [Pygocentrus nattereri]